MIHCFIPEKRLQRPVRIFYSSNKRHHSFSILVFTNFKFVIKILLLHMLTNVSFYSTDVNLHRLRNHRFFNSFKIILRYIQESSVCNSSHCSTAWRKILSTQNIQLTSLTFWLVHFLYLPMQKFWHYTKHLLEMMKQKQFSSPWRPTHLNSIHY